VTWGERGIWAMGGKENKIREREKIDGRENRGEEK